VTGILRAEAVAYRYPQNNYGLAPISLAVQPGERLLVAGPSGCGKSTLARCLAGLIPHLYRGALEGDVWLDGLHTAATPLWRLAERAGLVFQNPAAQMLGQSVEEEIVFGLENLGLSPPAIRESLEATLDRFGLEPLRKRSPQTLSGGEQQKLALAAIMARRPPILILDEPPPIWSPTWRTWPIPAQPSSSASTATRWSTPSLACRPSPCPAIPRRRCRSTSHTSPRASPPRRPWMSLASPSSWVAGPSCTT
jgi:energy-coupling factor transporter ATP-binding protein EcfA2